MLWNEIRKKLRRKKDNEFNNGGKLKWHGIIGVQEV